MNTRFFSISAVFLLTAALVACGEPVDDATCGCDSDEQRSGLDLDPLSGLDLADGPDLNDVPDEMQDTVASAKEGDARILWFYGRVTENDDTQEYTYRADVAPMDGLNDEEFEVAVDILSKRNDITGITEQPLESNGYSSGDGDSWSQFFTMVTYDPDADPAPQPDVQSRIEMIEDEIDTALADNGEDPNLDSQGRLEANIDFDWNDRWFYHVDVFDPSEVAAVDVARETGKARSETEIDAHFDEMGEKLDDLAQCVEHDRLHDGAVGVYGCEEDSIDEIVDIAEQVLDFSLFGDLTSGPSEPSNGAGGG